MINKLLLMGNLVKDVENPSENIARFTIAVNREYKKADGTRECDYFNIVCWNDLAKNCLKYLSKGSKVLVDGYLENRNYQKDGETKYVMEIKARAVEFLDSKKNEEMPY